MLTLRGHHLICLHFFSGEGYDLRFVENLKYVLKKAETEEIEITSDADNICAECSYLKEHKCRYDENADKEIRAMDEAALTLLNLVTSQKITWQSVKERLLMVFHEWYERYCNKCDWKQTCENNIFYHEMKTG